ncbi:MAG: hypothetical protein JSR18_11540 [Proteobacteria bacterium]|nr:hypothetical protein [Pseudomonadota bacterium]
MKLTCYAVYADVPELRPAPATRAWMDATPDRHAYRCLPLVIANAHGWEVLAPIAFTATWNGEAHPRNLVLADDHGRPVPPQLASSHFGQGIITLQPGYLFRTEPGWNLFASGPLNAPKDGIAPLAGIIEADWLPFPFSMNWQMTRPGRVRFEAGEPLCALFPVPRGVVSSVEPEIVALDEHPDVAAALHEWQARRAALMRELAANPRPLKDAWLRDYFVGRMPDGTPIEGHETRIKPAVPKDLRPGRKDGDTR